jgi:general secretion pathway protein F
MMSFEAIVRTPAGTLQTLRVSAASAALARERAGANGAQVLSCKAQAQRMTLTGQSQGQARARGGKATLDAAVFALEMGSLVDAGMPVVGALQTLADGQRQPTARQQVLDVQAAINQGQRLSEALDGVKPPLPPLLIATVRASEQSGNLSAALSRYAEHQQSFKALRDSVLGAAIYPAVLLLLGSVVVLFLLGGVVPKFATLIETTRHDLPWSSQLLMSWGRFVNDHGTGAIAFGLVFLAILVVGGRRLLVEGTRSSWVVRLPLVGELVREFQRSQMYRTAGLLVQGGTPLNSALQLCERLLSIEDLPRLQACMRLINEGRGLTDAFRESGLADPAAAGMLSVAERTGTLGAILERVASFKEARLHRAIEWTSRLIEPALMIIIGLVIGSIVVLMYLPIFDLASSLQ